MVKLLTIFESNLSDEPLLPPCKRFPRSGQGQFGWIAPPQPLQTVQESASHGHAVVEARRVFQRGDRVEPTPQTGVRLPNLSQESTSVAQQKWLRRQKRQWFSLDHQRQIKQVARRDAIATVIHLLGNDLCSRFHFDGAASDVPGVVSENGK